jgi:hypothetical protein
VSGCGAEIGITLAPEHAQVIVRWWMPVEELVGCVVVAWTTRAAIECVSGGIQGLGPERRRNVGVEQHGADAVVEGAEDSLGAAILLRRVGACEPEDNVVGRC